MCTAVQQDPQLIPCSEGLHCHIAVPVTMPCTAQGAQPSPAMLCVPWGATQSPCMAQGATQPPHQRSAQLTVQYDVPPILIMQHPAQLVCSATPPPPTLQHPAQPVCSATPPITPQHPAKLVCNAPPINALHSSRCNATPPEQSNLPHSNGHSAAPHPRHPHAPGRHNPCSNAFSPPLCIPPQPRSCARSAVPPPRPACHVLPRSPAMCTPVSSRVKAAASQLQWLERTAPEHIWFNASAWRLA